MYNISTRMDTPAIKTSSTKTTTLQEYFNDVIILSNVRVIDLLHGILDILLGVDTSIDKDFIRRNISKNSIDMVELLLIDIQCASENNTEVVKSFLTDVHDASKNNTEKAKLLLANIQHVSANGSKAIELLHVDAAHISENITRSTKLLLADDRIDPSFNNNFAIQFASEHGRTDIVKLLLGDKRIDPAANNNYAIQHALENNHMEIFYLLKETYKNNAKENYITEKSGKTFMENIIHIEKTNNQYVFCLSNGAEYENFHFRFDY